MKNILLSLATVLLIGTSSVSAAEGTLFYNSHGVESYITSESMWSNGLGWDAVVYSVDEFGHEETFVFGVSCQIGNEYAALVENGRVTNKVNVAPYSGQYSGMVGYYNDLWHNVCLDDNRY